MAIQRPGLRRREGTKLASLKNPRRRPSVVSLSMTSMIDVFVVLTVFLLISFSTNESHAGHDVPIAKNVSEMVDAPIIDVQAAGTFLDGVKVSSNEELVAKLKAKRALAEQLTPGRPPDDHVILSIDPDVPSGVVKAVVTSAAAGGYPSLDFMVQKG